MRRLIHVSILLGIGLSLGACATRPGEYPSLERRPAERITATYPVAAPPAPIPLPPPPAGVTNRLDALVGAARSADAKFRQKEPRARALVNATGQARMGSEAWGTATIAVAELESARAEAMIPLSDLDILYNDTTVRGEDPSAIGAARDTVVALIAQQDQVLGELRTRLGS